MFYDSDSESLGPEVGYHDYLDAPMKNCKAQDLIDKEIASHEAAIRELRVRRNTYSPISRLPAELLAKIFILGRWIIDNGHVFPGSLSVANICHGWRDIFVDTTQVWDTLDLSTIKSLECAVTTLARSKQAPLHVQCSSLRPPDPSVLSVVLSQITRIQHLDIDILTQSPAILEIFGSEKKVLPTMRRLVLRRTALVAETIPVFMERIFSMDMPFLHVLELRNTYLPSVRLVPPLPHLWKLQIVEPTRSLSLSDILTVLRGTPALGELELLHALRVEPGDQVRGQHEYTTVNLPQLSSLSLESHNFDIALLFRYIYYPPSARMRFLSAHCPDDNDGLQSLSNVLSHFAQSESAALVDHMWLMRHPDILGFQMGASLANVTLLDIHCEARSIVDESYLFNLHTLLPSLQIRTLLVGGFVTIKRTEWKELFKRHQQVQKLVVEQVDPCVIQALTNAPGQGEGDDQRQQGVLLPQLTSLRLWRCSFDGRDSHPKFTSCVSEFLQQRVDRKMPLNIFKLYQCNIRLSTVNSLRNILEVDWDQARGWARSLDTDSE